MQLRRKTFPCRSFVLIMSDMERITSRKNKIIAHFRSLAADREYRKQCGEFVCDGAKMYGEALLWGAQITAVLTGEAPDVVPDCPVYTLPTDLLEYASPLKSTRGPVFSVRMPEKTLPDKSAKVIVLEGVQDPGNVGTVVRTANAFSMDAVVLVGDCADLYNPKTIRATMGAVFRQCVLPMELRALSAALREAGLPLFGAALAEDAADIREVDKQACAVAIGSEGHGLSAELLEMCEKKILIPMNAACESLNAAVAAAVVMWELAR